MYFDDGTFQNWSSTGAHGQVQIGELVRLLGSPWAPAKSQACSSSGSFRGLQHDCRRAHLGVITFCPMQHLVEKVLHIIKVAGDVGLLSGTAAKLYGVTNFLESGMYGRVGRAGLNAVKQRQYEAGAEVTQPLAEAFAMLKDLLSLHPSREYLLFPHAVRRVLVAADASFENGKGKACFLLIANQGTPEVSRVGRVLASPAISTSNGATR